MKHAQPSRGIVSLPDVLDDLFTRAAQRSEQRLARLRLIVCGLGFVNVGIASSGFSDAFSNIRYTTLLSILVVATVYSIFMLRTMDRKAPSQRLLSVSAALDAVLAMVILAPSILWPSATWPGLVHVPHAFFFPLVMIASGLRLSKNAVRWTAVVSGFGVVVLLAIDFASNWAHGTDVLGPNRITIDDYTLYAMMLFFALLLANALSGRTRALVQEGGEALVQAERARQRLGVYVSPEVADMVLTSDAIQPGGQRQLVTVLFSDLRGFTSYSENLPPERLVRELNAYLDAMVEVIDEEGGIVDKYMGDAIMVVWGVPEPGGDDAACAIRTAWGMQVALAKHNEERKSAGAPPLEQGIGVHHGAAIAGNVGTFERLQYTVIGEVVNLASRLQYATKETGAPVLLSMDAVEAAGARERLPELASHAPVTVRGRREPIEVMTFGTET